jgi:hypothetical protein
MSAGAAGEEEGENDEEEEEGGLAAVQSRPWTYHNMGPGILHCMELLGEDHEDREDGGVLCQGEIDTSESAIDTYLDAVNRSVVWIIHWELSRYPPSVQGSYERDSREFLRAVDELKMNVASTRPSIASLVQSEGDGEGKGQGQGCDKGYPFTFKFKPLTCGACKQPVNNPGSDGGDGGGDGGDGGDMKDCGSVKVAVNKMTVKQLKVELTSRELTTDGLKAVRSKKMEC